MKAIESYERTVKHLFKAFEFVKLGQFDADDITRWLDLTNAAIAGLELLLNNSKDSTRRAEKKKCETCLTHLNTFKQRLFPLVSTGGNLQQGNNPASVQQQQQQHQPERESVKWDDFRSAFKSRIRSGVISNIAHKDLSSFLNDAFSLFESKIQQALVEFNSIKVNAMLSAEFVIQKSDLMSTEVKYFSTENGVIYKLENLSKFFDSKIISPLQRNIEEFQERDSGWTLRQILSLTININKHQPMRGSSYIDLPLSIQAKHACLNIQNYDDEECFKWAVLSARFPKNNNPQRVHLYQREEYMVRVNFKGITFPTPARQIPIFERNNADISINLYVLEKNNKQNYDVTPCHLSSANNKMYHINLLIIHEEQYYSNVEEEEEEEDFNTPLPKYHYVWIKNLSRLVRSQYTKHEHKAHICDRCLHFFRSDEKLCEHGRDCRQVNQCKVILPDVRNRFLEFSHVNHKEKVNFIIYADFECLLRPVQDERAYQEHQAYSVGFYIKNSFSEELCEYRSYRQSSSSEEEETPAQWFVKNLLELCPRMERIVRNQEEMTLTEEDMRAFSIAKKCHICRRPFEKDDMKVRDHCHYTSR